VPKKSRRIWHRILDRNPSQFLLPLNNSDKFAEPFGHPLKKTSSN